MRYIPKLFDDIYLSNNVIWTIDGPDGNLISMLEDHSIEPCKVLEIGCGIGFDSVWMIQNGFEAYSIDYSSVAINEAKQYAISNNVTSTGFSAINILDYTEQNNFDLIYDRGFFHTLDLGQERTDVLNKIHSLLTSSGYWISFQLKTDEDLKYINIYKDADEITTTVSGLFTVEDIFVGECNKQSDEHGNYPPPGIYTMWCCLFKKIN